MKHEIKMKLRRLSSSNMFFRAFYSIASNVKYILLSRMNDEEFLKRKYKENTGKELNLHNPQTFNEKLQWLKLYYHKPEFTIMADKLNAREFVKKTLGKSDLLFAQLYGVYSCFDEIDFDQLPSQFVLKCTHDSGSVVVCKDKSKLDKSKAKKTLDNGIKRNYFHVGREWPYKNIVPRIIAEEYLRDETQDNDNVNHFYSTLNAWKIFCFCGEPRLLCYTTDKPPDIRQDYYNTKFEEIDLSIGYKKSDKPISKPDNFNKMIEIARQLSKGMPFIRIDLFNIKGQIYFNEFTFYSWGGMAKYDPPEWDSLMGEWTNLPEPFRSIKSKFKI